MIIHFYIKPLLNFACEKKLGGFMNEINKDFKKSKNLFLIIINQIQF